MYISTRNEITWDRPLVTKTQHHRLDPDPASLRLLNQAINSDNSQDLQHELYRLHGEDAQLMTDFMNNVCRLPCWPRWHILKYNSSKLLNGTDCWELIQEMPSEAKIARIRECLLQLCTTSHAFPKALFVTANPVKFPYLSGSESTVYTGTYDGKKVAMKLINYRPRPPVGHEITQNVCMFSFQL